MNALDAPARHVHAWVGCGASLAINGAVLAAVIGFAWDAREVLLVYWSEITFCVLLLPFAAWLRSGAAAAVDAVRQWPLLLMFLGFHAFFLCGLMFGADWSRVEKTSGGFAVPSVGTPMDCFAEAAAVIPLWAVIVIAVAQATRIVLDQHLSGVGDDAASSAVGGVLLMHFVIVFGGFAILASGGAIGMLMLLVALKTGAEVTAALWSLRN